MKKKTKKKTKKKIVLQSFGIYKDQMLVASGVTFDEIIAWLKKQKNSNKEFVSIIEEDKERLEDLRKKTNGFHVFDEEAVMHLLYIKPFEDDWEWYGTLMHECLHVVQRVVEQKMLTKELESQAYFHEFLFNEIRRKLMCP